MTAAAGTLTLRRILPLQHPLEFLPLQQELLDQFRHGTGSLRRVAFMTFQIFLSASVDRRAVFLNGKGFNRRRFEHQRPLVISQAQQPVIGIEKQASAAETEIVTPGLGKGVPQGLIVVIKGQVLPEPCQVHLIHCAVRQIDFPVTFLADRHVLDLCGQQTRGRIATDWTYFFMIAE